MRRGPAVRSALLRLFLLLLPLLYGCATLPYDYPRTLSTALYLPEATAMGKKIQPQVAEHQGASGFYLLSSGEDAFLARVRLIDRAEKTLDLQHHPGLVCLSLRHGLRDWHDRDVEMLRFVL